jgi:hypothetical protein
MMIKGYTEEELRRAAEILKSKTGRDHRVHNGRVVGTSGNSVFSPYQPVSERVVELILKEAK